MKRIISFILIIALFCVCALSESGMTREDAYQKGIDALLDETAEGYEVACAFFVNAGGYGNAKYFIMYIEALLALMRDEVDSTGLAYAENRFNILSRNVKFTSELGDYSDLPSCEDLLRYVAARRCELNDDIPGALAIYTQLFILDTSERYLDIMDAFTNHDHIWSEATCETPRICAICGMEDDGSALGHDYAPATYEAPKTCTRCGATKGEKLNPEYQVGDYVTFGNYPQTAEGTDNTPIEWIVLDREGDEYLLISEQVLDVQPFNTVSNEGNWENSTLRTWLNDDFYNRAFSASEKSQIKNATVRTEVYDEVIDFNYYYTIETIDNVFLLSCPEFMQYFSWGDSFGITNYAMAKSETLKDQHWNGLAANKWIMRTAKHIKMNTYVSYQVNFTVPQFSNGCADTFDQTYGVRPCIWVKLP